MTIGPLSIDMYLPAFPELARGLDTSASQVQLTLTACVAGLALGQLLIGPLSDRFGRRLPLIAALST
jgi:MFS transporter, DHA1 family, multidrug resistance protein